MIDMIYSDEVAEARAKGAPIVALESTIITHGMPYPQNVETARRVEETVRQGGATPATIAVIAGALHVGLNGSQLDALGQAKDVMKLSRADMAACLASGRTGATTVAATMIAARLAGIEVFATGGIGGVHRGAETSFDISADLHELAQTPVTVIAAGAKAILDLPKTLEVLETLGVPVVGYRTRELPGFFSMNTGLALTASLDTPDQIAAAWLAHRAVGGRSAMLVVQPPPAASALPAELVNDATDAALAAASAAGVRGAAVTPFLLADIQRRTAGQSVVANLALLESNAALAGRIAVALAAARVESAPT